MSVSYELKLTAVWMGDKPPAEELKLTDYALPVLGANTPGLFHALYGNRSAYMALGELLRDAQLKRKYYSTATVTLRVRESVKTGVVHLEDIQAGRTGMINLSRVSKEVMHELASIYQSIYAPQYSGADEEELDEGTRKLLESTDWRKPHRFMPDHLEGLNEVFNRLQPDVLIHPVRFITTPEDKQHFIASFKLDEIEIVDVKPNLFEVGPHPKKIVW